MKRQNQTKALKLSFSLLSTFSRVDLDCFVVTKTVQNRMALSILLRILIELVVRFFFKLFADAFLSFNPPRYHLLDAISVSIKNLVRSSISSFGPNSGFK